ncbi:MAG: alpha/beta fold hydrolase [Gammaproteobacteria bacterium]|nr:alpha/beta fold hydrolase [Gammaproteobacteria bacterium]
MRKIISAAALLLVFVAPLGLAQKEVLSLDHYVANVSKAPSMQGQVTQIYVRERTQASTALRRDNLEGRVVLFIHGAGTPAEVAFDVPAEGYSWMAYLANAGYDTFSMDTTGYGRSTRPAVMNDICNLPESQQASFIPALLDESCEPSYPFAATTIESDWDDIDAVVDYLREIRGVDKVHMVAWSSGGPRAAGYAALHPEKVDRIVLLAPAYGRNRSANPPDNIPAPGAAFTKQSRQDFSRNWDRQIGCENQYDPAVSDAVWQAMLDSDPVGATWGTGVRRAPRTTVWGWNKDVVAKTQTPMLIVSPIHDAQVPPSSVRNLYEDLGAEEKILLDLACSSHNAMWEINHEILFNSTLQWLTQGTVDGITSGELRKGY